MGKQARGLRQAQAERMRVSIPARADVELVEAKAPLMLSLSKHMRRAWLQA